MKDYTGQSLEVTFTALTPEKRTQALHEGAAVSAHGVLPGETARVNVVRQRERQLISEVEEVITPSSTRIKPREEHYLYCSPWQILEYSAQCEAKKKFFQETLSSFPGFDASRLDFQPASETFGYRTSIEYSFTTVNNKLTLSMRGHDEHVTLPQGCLLASEGMNKAALQICDALREQNIPAETLRALIIRESKTKTGRIATLYMRTSDTPRLTIGQIEGLTGLMIAHADPERLVPTPKKVLLREGKLSLEEVFGSISIQYPINAFFQNNIPLYTQALQDLKANLPPTQTLVELYSGVGSIGLFLADRVKTVRAYEVSEDMVEYAKKNAQRNNINNYTAQAVAAENLSADTFANTDTVVVNPTRRGLQSSVVTNLLKAAPRYIAYLSCNIGTLTRDLSALSKEYNLHFAKGYDFYPNTPHQESLCILKRK